MGKTVFANPFISIGGTALSDDVQSATLDYAADEVEDTTGGQSTHTFLGGLKDWTLTVEFAQDHAASKVDATLWPLVGANSTALIIRPSTAAVSVTNPQFSATSVLTTYPPLGGNSIGDLATTTATFRPNGTSPDLTRTTA